MADRVSELLTVQCLCLSTISSFLTNSVIARDAGIMEYATEQLTNQVCGRQLKS